MQPQELTGPEYCPIRTLSGTLERCCRLTAKHRLENGKRRCFSPCVRSRRARRRLRSLLQNPLLRPNRFRVPPQPPLRLRRICSAPTWEATAVAIRASSASWQSSFGSTIRQRQSGELFPTLAWEDVSSKRPTRSSPVRK